MPLRLSLSPKLSRLKPKANSRPQHRPAVKRAYPGMEKPMLHRLTTITAATLFVLCLGIGSAWACSVPNIFVNNTIADADQMDANFTAVLNCVNVNSVVGPNISTNGGGVCWNNTTGSLLKDCSIGSVSAGLSNPAGNATATQVMMGLGSTCTLTPNRSGKIKISIWGGQQNSVGGDGISWHMRWGTGGAPGNGASGATGTAITSNQLLFPQFGGLDENFLASATISGATLGTPL